MLDDNYNEDSKEENASKSSDEDFGFPDLDFDELSDTSLPVDESTSLESEEIDMSVLDNIEIPKRDVPEELQSEYLDSPKESFLDEGISEVEDVLDSVQLISDRLGDDELTEEDNSSSNDDLLANIDSPDDLAALGIDEEASSDDSSSLFSTSDTNTDANDDELMFSADSLSIQQDEGDFESSDDSLSPSYKPYSDDSTHGSFAKIIGLIVIVTFLLGGTFWYFDDRDRGNAEKAIAQNEEIQNEEVQNEEASDSTANQHPNVVDIGIESKEPTTVQKIPVVANPTTTTTGDIERVTDKTGRCYVIINSFIDEDLAMDYALKLQANDIRVKIISYGRGHRTAIADYGNYSDAVSQLGTYKEKYGDQVWISRY